MRLVFYFVTLVNFSEAVNLLSFSNEKTSCKVAKMDANGLCAGPSGCYAGASSGAKAINNTASQLPFILRFLDNEITLWAAILFFQQELMGVEK
ncbi:MULTISPECIES: hypothetical protein [Pantoea]|jgi:hypothetical protein|uniref:hypothetical protein n=1 Tax=Pantoea TaxID=53335 RepID=UPI000EA215FD|nr:MULTISPECIES: hypothetical protein [Pantoea]HCW99116.1 hypothetical protein [Pantoea sp.]MBZ6387533.1 hypothetical protein [Pantoea piersonii]MBZ6402050.1 hypothetical protein [Pantoea piersonii]MBZ6408806.1 hypothetical protein [Pantoea piersonii]MBZ6428872.1 hypothetical protein [Pantoea piersonii]